MTRASTALITGRSAPAASPSPDVAHDSISGADAIADAVSDHNATVAGIIERLDSFGFTVGDTRFSLWTALVVVLVILFVFVAARLGTKVARRLLNRMSSLSPTQNLLADKLVTIAVWTLALLIGIDMLGIDLTTLAVFSGAFGLAIGFGLQKTFGNLIAGIILLLDRSIKPGDVIAVSDMSGRESFGQIRRIGIRAISVITRDKKEYLIPNENLMINQVENWSYSTRDVRVKVPVSVSYETDITLAEELMLQAAKDAPRVLDIPETRVLLRAIGGGTIDFEIRLWIDDPEEGIGAVQSDVLKRVWHLFRDNNIEVPFQQRDLYLRDSAPFRALLDALEQRDRPAPDTPPPRS